MKNAFSLFELNEHIRRVLALNLPDPVWLTCEIAQVTESRGHFFLDLVQKSAEGEEIIAQSTAVLWKNTYRKLKRQTGAQLGGLLHDGMEVMLKAKVDFNERYGLKLVIEDVDPAFTLGQLEISRRRTIEKLRSENLLGANRQRSLPPAIKNIAIISSERAAGLQDFLREIEGNPYGYLFKMEVFPAAVQGQAAEQELLLRLEEVHEKAEQFDCLVIVRGGGARLDLRAFDQAELCRNAALFPLPIISGIGHEVDETVLDLVVHTAMKTPTAAAAFIVQQNLEFESRLLELSRQVYRSARERIYRESMRIDQIALRTQQNAGRTIDHQCRDLDTIRQQLPNLSRWLLTSHHRQLDEYEKLSRLLSLENTLKRGFT
ncbi:MAG: exodeoxyribonuclease VII large subunit, partial [Saprospiraceae bacterium]|nr:exodeoxyribonuclease VII large subunit [Saprospiraceae bacterium]